MARFESHPLACNQQSLRGIRFNRNQTAESYMHVSRLSADYTECT